MREYFLTGCDDKTEWQLPWFMDNFRQHNQGAKIVLADFGMSEFMRSSMESSFELDGLVVGFTVTPSED